MRHDRRVSVGRLFCRDILLVARAVAATSSRPSSHRLWVDASAQHASTRRSVLVRTRHPAALSLRHAGLPRPAVAGVRSRSGDQLDDFARRPDLHLRAAAGREFHDGTPFNAQAVAANLDRITNPMTASQKALFLLGPYTGYEIVDDYTIRLLLSEPYSPLLDSLSQVYLGIASPAALRQITRTNATSFIRLARVPSCLSITSPAIT